MLLGICIFSLGGWSADSSHSEQARDPEGHRSTLNAIERGETEARQVEGFTLVFYPDLTPFNYNHKANGTDLHLPFEHTISFP